MDRTGIVCWTQCYASSTSVSTDFSGLHAAFTSKPRGSKNQTRQRRHNSKKTLKATTSPPTAHPSINPHPQIGKWKTEITTRRHAFSSLNQITHLFSRHLVSYRLEKGEGSSSQPKKNLLLFFIFKKFTGRRPVGPQDGVNLVVIGNW